MFFNLFEKKERPKTQNYINNGKIIIFDEKKMNYLLILSLEKLFILYFEFYHKVILSVIIEKNWFAPFLIIIFNQ